MPLCLYPRWDGTMYRSEIHQPSYLSGGNKKRDCVMCLKKLTLRQMADDRWGDHAWQTMIVIKEWP